MRDLDFYDTFSTSQPQLTQLTEMQFIPDHPTSVMIDYKQSCIFIR